MQLVKHLVYELAAQALEIVDERYGTVYGVPDSGQNRATTHNLPLYSTARSGKGEPLAIKAS